MATSLEARLARLEGARAALAARPMPSATEVYARAAALIAIADPGAEMTPRNRRACRVAQLLEAAGERQAADLLSLA